MEKIIRFSTSTVSLLLILSTCSFVNRESGDYYRRTHMRHWIVPLGSKIEAQATSVSRMRGEHLYRKHCLYCHGQEGLGDGPGASKQKTKPTNLQNLVRQVEDFKFYMAVSELEGGMPGWKEPLTEEEAEDLATYMKSFK